MLHINRFFLLFIFLCLMLYLCVFIFTFILFSYLKFVLLIFKLEEVSLANSLVGTFLAGIKRLRFGAPNQAFISKAPLILRLPRVIPLYTKPPYTFDLKTLISLMINYFLSRVCSRSFVRHRITFKFCVCFLFIRCSR